MATYWCQMDSPIGILLLGATEKGLCRIGLPNESRAAFLAALERLTAEQPQEDRATLAAAVAQLREYFARLRRDFTIPLDLRGTQFQLAVWQEMATIPYGSTVSYGQLALRLGRGRGSARAVGAASGANPIPIVIPCHRVIRADGSLGGYGGGLAVKRTLLHLERVEIPATSGGEL